MMVARQKLSKKDVRRILSAIDDLQEDIAGLTEQLEAAILEFGLEKHLTTVPYDSGGFKPESSPALTGFVRPSWYPTVNTSRTYTEGKDER